MSDNIYVNLSINNSTSGGNVLTSQPAKVSISYEQPLLQKASDYYLSVVKFELPLQSLPLFVFPIVPNQANPNLSTMVVGVCENEATPGVPITTLQFSQTVIWETQSWNTQVPVQNQSYFVYTSYYDCYAYSHFVYLVNKALLAAWTAAGSPGGANQQPYFYYDNSTTTINLVYPYDFVNAASTTGTGWKVFINDAASYYFQAFDYEINNGRFEIATHSLATDYSYVAPSPWPQGTGPNTAGSTYICKAEYPSNDYINSIRKVVFVTNGLPIQKEYFPSPNTNQGGISYLGVLSDFNLDLNNKAGAQRSVALYEANIYRLVDLLSTGPLRNIDLAVYWADRLGFIYPLNIGTQDLVSIKLGFFSKALYNNDGTLKR